MKSISPYILVSQPIFVTDAFRIEVRSISSWVIPLCMIILILSHFRKWTDTNKHAHIIHFPIMECSNVTAHKSNWSIKCETLTNLTIYNFISEWGYIHDSILMQLRGYRKQDRNKQNMTMTRAKLFHFSVYILSYSYEVGEFTVLKALGFSNK